MPVTPPPAADTQVASSADNPMDMPPMATAGQSTDDAVATTGTDAAGVLLSGKSAPPNGTAAARDVGRSRRNDRDRRPAFEDEDVIRSAEQFVTMFNRRGREGGKLRIAAGADLELSSIEIDGTGPLQITAEPGSATRRPRLRFRIDRQPQSPRGLDRDVQPPRRIAACPGYRPCRS